MTAATKKKYPGSRSSVLERIQRDRFRVQKDPKILNQWNSWIPSLLFTSVSYKQKLTTKAFGKSQWHRNTWWPFFMTKSHFSWIGTESTIAVIFFWSSGLLAPTSLSICSPSRRKKKVGVALMSHVELKSCPIKNHYWTSDILLPLAEVKTTHNIKNYCSDKIIVQLNTRHNGKLSLHLYK